MAEGGDLTLKEAEIVSLAHDIAAINMEPVALKYFGISSETLANLKREHREDVEAFNRAVIRNWARRNSSPNQVQVLARILYTAAREGNYVDPSKMEAILGVKQEETPTITENLDTDHSTDMSMSDEIAKMIEELKQYTEEAMKIEMAPWVESYTVDMNDLYSELTLEQTENKPTGQEIIKLKNYAQLFTEQKATDQQEKSSLDENPNSSSLKGKRKKGKKILAKGDPGTGKTTFGRKIAYDWAKGEFTAVSVVFFLSMKKIKKGQTVESVIIQQNPPIESLDITEESLSKILKDLGSRCLIILDGFDECDLQAGDDFHKIIEGRKLPHCSLVVTSRPHNCEKIEKCFSTKVRVNGFSQGQAEQFMSKCLSNKEKIQAVSYINTHNFRSPEGYSNPMLLLFLCVLENGNELDLNTTVISLGEIYFRLIRCIYRKYCVRKGTEFDNNKFLQVLRKAGKIAWEMLESGTNFAKQSEIIREVGHDAFEYGLFTGHKNYGLMSKETKEIFVAFAHQTIQEFLGAFHCISLWDIEGEVHISDRFPPIEFYFLRFCLWLLSDKCSHVKFSKHDDILMALAQYVADQIDFVQLDLTDFSLMFTALQLSNFKSQDQLLYRFMTKVLSLCKNVKELFVNSSDPVGHILEALSSLVPSLVLVANKNTFLNGSDYFRANHMDSCENELVVMENTKPYLGMTGILNRFACKPLTLILHANKGDEDLEITEFCHENQHKLHIYGFDCSHLSGNRQFPRCSSLTELSLSNVHVDESVLKALSVAVEMKHFPTLSKLSFRNCGSSLKRKLHLLFRSTWPTLTHLTIDGCELDYSDVQLLPWNKENKHCLLPSLIAVTIDLIGLGDCSSVIEALTSMFKTTCQELTNLSLCNMTEKIYREVVSSINSGHLPGLTQLSLAMQPHIDECEKETIPSPAQQSSNVEKLEPVRLPTLTFLALHNSLCTESDLLAAVRSAEFSNVHKLDISHSSHIGGKLYILLKNSFPSLECLVLSDCGLNPVDLDNLAWSGTKSRLPALRHLDISRNSDIQGHLRNLFLYRQKWSNLLFFNVEQGLTALPMDDVQVILIAARLGCFSSLTELEVSITGVISICDYLDSPWSNLRTIRAALPPNSSCTTDEILRAIGEGVQNELFPKLREIWLKESMFESKKELDHTKQYNLIRSDDPFFKHHVVELLRDELFGHFGHFSGRQNIYHTLHRQWEKTMGPFPIPNSIQIVQRTMHSSMVKSLSMKYNTLPKREFEIVELLTKFVSAFTFLRQRGVRVNVFQSDFKK